MQTRPQIPHKNRKRWIIASAVLAASLFLLPKSSTAVFEYSTLYGMGAASFALGPTGIPSLDDPMAYILNPAMFALDNKRKLILTIGGMKARYEDDDSFSLSGFGYLTPKGAFSLLRCQEPYISHHNELIYTAAKMGTALAYGVNLRLFEFRERSGAKGSSATLDVGVHGELDNRRLWYDVVLRNIIGPSLSVDPVHRELDPELPKTLTIGLGYRLREDIRLYASHQNELSSQGDPDREMDFSRWNFGIEYTLPERYSVRGGGSEHDLLVGERDDRSATAGGSFRTDTLTLDVGWMVKNDYFSNAHVMTLAYTKKEDEPPPPEVEDEKTEEKTLKPLPVIEEERSEEDFEDYEPISVVEKPPEVKAPLRKFDEFSIEPEAILAAAPGRSDFKDLEGHWAEAAVKNLARNGYILAESKNFKPSKPIKREEFYRLLFTVQLENLFRNPLEIRLFTPIAGELIVELEGAALKKPLKLMSRRLEESGWQAITLPPAIFEEKDVLPGRYKVVCRLEGETGDSFRGAGGVTVLDTAMDFDRFADMGDEERKTEVEEMKARLDPLGMPLDYLNNLRRTGDVARIEALTSALMALEADWEDIPMDDAFPDTWGLEEKEKKAVYLATRGLDNLKGAALMNGYGDGAFRPLQAMTRAEAAGFTAKLRKISPSDLEPPYSPPLIAGKTVSVSLLPALPDKPPRKPRPPHKQPYWLVALTTSTEHNAIDFAATLSDEGLAPTIVEEKTAGGTLYHVLFGMYSSVVEAEAERRRLEVSGYQVYLSGPPEMETFALPSAPPAQAKKQPAEEKCVIEIPLYNTPPIPDNLDTTGYKAPKTKHDRYKLITK